MTQEEIERLKSQYSNNPLFSRAKKMANGKSPKELEQIAKNLCKEKGISFEEAWRFFQQQFKF